ncbi:hypothetical protein [Vibrio owensii]|uniref:hypothetical protein n=1 Tax=Vibrio owensii TaxID=696485 RepID=UPI000B0F5DDE|nr:hypothetical protein [Vibrio owensii]
MVTLIAQKKALASERVELVKEILEELTKSNSTFPSSRKLSEYVAQKMTDKGSPVDSSTLRRSGTQYKCLIDGYVGKKEKKPDEETRLALKVRQQNMEIQRLASLVNDLEHIVRNKENEIRFLLVDAQDKRNKVMASISPPKASTYTQTELAQLKESHKRDRAQLSKALEVIKTLLKFELKTEVNNEGSYEVKNGKVIDLLAECELLNEENLPDFFK